MTDTERSGAGPVPVPAQPVGAASEDAFAAPWPDPARPLDDRYRDRRTAGPAVDPTVPDPMITAPAETGAASTTAPTSTVPTSTIPTSTEAAGRHASADATRPDPLPGRVWGIVSLALAVIPLLQLVGLAAGIVGLVLSLRAGRRNWFAVAGIAVSLLLLALAGTLVVLFAFTGYEVFGGSVGSVVTVCSELGPGEHVVDGLTYRCG